VSDKVTGAPIGGVTVIVQGPQGEDATLTDDRGDYTFTNLPIATYTIRFYFAGTSTQVEQSGVVVSPYRTLRVNAKLAGTAAAASQETYVITGKAPSIDVGSARIGTQFDEEYTRNIPLDRTYGDLLQRAPGAFVDGSGNVSIGGSTGLENIYLVNGQNVTGLRFGNLESGAASLGGGSNIPLEFLSQVDVSSGGYGPSTAARWAASSTASSSPAPTSFTAAPSYWSPTGCRPIRRSSCRSEALGGVRKPDFDDSVGVEWAAIIRTGCFLVGFAPRITNNHVFRLTYAQTEADPVTGMPTGAAVLDASGNPPSTSHRRRAHQETRKTYYFAGTVDWVPSRRTS
jgi:hypothetical protein